MRFATIVEFLNYLVEFQPANELLTIHDTHSTLRYLSITENRDLILTGDLSNASYAHLIVTLVLVRDCINQLATNKRDKVYLNDCWFDYLSAYIAHTDIFIEEKYIDYLKDIKSLRLNPITFLQSNNHRFYTNLYEVKHHHLFYLTRLLKSRSVNLGTIDLNKLRWTSVNNFFLLLTSNAYTTGILSHLYFFKLSKLRDIIDPVQSIDKLRNLSELDKEYLLKLDKFRNQHKIDHLIKDVNYLPDLIELSKRMIKHHKQYGNKVFGYLESVKTYPTDNELLRMIELDRLRNNKQIIAGLPEETILGGWTRYELNSVGKLLEEGDYQSNCIGGYANNIRNYNYRIFSLRKLIDNVEHRISYAIREVEDGVFKIIEVKARFNKSVESVYDTKEQLFIKTAINQTVTDLINENERLFDI